ncbi:MAG: DNA alkylation repair protein [Ignavibacteriae bacterium]|nr:DNA alkylation repair protein [Ignavibacteriota bacterium]
MTPNDVIKLLEKQKNARGIAAWERMGDKSMKSFGMGMTQLRQVAKKIGKDHELALKLWESDYYEARVVAALIDDPKKVKLKQVEAQTKSAGFWMLCYVYTSLIAQTSFAQELAEKWMKSKDDLQRRSGYLVLSKILKEGTDLDDKFLESQLETFEQKLQKEENFVKDAMNVAMLAIGMRNKKLNKRAVQAAKKIGTVQVDYGDNSCEAVDCIKHLTNPALLKRLA